RGDGPAVDLPCPAHVRAGRGAGQTDERDRLPAHDVVADGHERKRGVVVAALDAALLDAPAAPADRDPADGVNDAVVGRADDRAVRRGDVDAGVAALEELRDRAGDRSHEAAT